MGWRFAAVDHWYAECVQSTCQTTSSSKSGIGGIDDHEAAFAFAGRTRSGESVSGERVAESVDSAVAALRREQILVTKIDAVQAKSGSRQKKGVTGKPVPPKSLAVFTRQFSVMIDAGLPLVECLEILGKQEDDANFRETILEVRGHVEGGSGLAEAMGQYPETFDALYSNMIAAGEAGGVLDTILNRLAIYVETNVKLRSQVKSALTYPVAVVVIAGLVVAAILWKVIPTFASLFEGLGAVLPLPTRVVIAVSESFVTVSPFLILGGGVGAVFLRRFYRTPRGRRVADGALLKAPVVGMVFAKLPLQGFAGRWRPCCPRVCRSSRGWRLPQRPREMPSSRTRS